MFIAFEGVDGAGKTTQLDLLANVLQTNGCEVVVYRDLTIYNKDEFARLSIEEQITFIINQRAAYASVLKGYSKSGAIVLLDRFIDSTLVYQGVDQINSDLIINQHKALVDIKPDLCLTFAFLNDDVLYRNPDDKDNLDIEFNHKRPEYNQKFIEKSYSKSRLIIDAALTIDALHDLINVHVHCNSTFTKLYKLKRCKNRALSVKK